DAFLILLLDLDDLGLRGPKNVGLRRRRNEIVDAAREARAPGVEDTEVLQSIEDVHRLLVAEPEMAERHEVRQALLLHGAVDERQARRARVGEDDATHPALKALCP